THTTSVKSTLDCPAVSLTNHAADFSGNRFAFSRQSFRISWIFSVLRPCLCNGITAQLRIVWQPIRCIVNIHVTPLPWHHFFYRFLDTAQAKPVFHVSDIRFLKPFYWPYLKTI